MKISIRNPAPLGPNQKKWGDYHFAQSLQRALEKQGASVVQKYWPQWDDPDEADVDAVLVLRGKRRYVPEPGRVSLLWIMSHPATITPQELDGYSRVFYASETHFRLADGATRSPGEVMRQCTDASLFGAFHGIGKPPEERRGIVFVANSRGVRRNIVRWALETSMPLDVYGRHWGSVEPGIRVRQDYVENENLPGLYASARLSLNDHWGDMAHFGVINNRVFDCLACGVPVLSDGFPELREVCGDALLYVDSAPTYLHAMQNHTLRYQERLDATRRLWERIGSDYTFDARAAQIVEAVRASRPHATEAKGASRGASSLGRALEFAVQMVQASGKGEIRSLHVNPSVDWMQRFLEIDGISYLSAGIGEGPWHLRADSEHALLPEASFDLGLVVDAGGGAADWGWWAELPGKLRNGGLILFTGEADNLMSSLPAVDWTPVPPPGAAFKAFRRN